MTASPTDTIIDQLAADVRPVRPLRAPVIRALLTLAAIGLAAAFAIVVFGDVNALRDRYAGRVTWLALEMLAMLSTAVLAIVAAFIVSIPGRSKRWLAAPLPPFALWLMLSGLGCYDDLVRRSGAGWEFGESLHCLSFIVGASAIVAPLIIWRLARARPIEPLPVALLGGLGIAAVSAFVLQFFHPFAVTFVDLAVHLAAILIVVGAIGLVNRRAFAPA